MNSLTLIEVLRRRRALPVGETWRLLDELPALLDDAERQGDLPAARLLNAVQVVFAIEAPGDCAGRSVSEWPAFHLDLLVDATQGETAVQVDSPDANGSARFAALLYELLGGPQRSDGAHPPLAALSEAANRTLQRALAGGGFASCTEFWREFLRESAGSPSGVRIPSALAGSGTQGEVLRLIPRDRSVPVHFIARSQFRIGRSVAEADLVTRLLPKTPENETRTHQLGRVNVCGEIVGGHPALRDGNGQQPSENGATLDGQPLAHDRAKPLTKRGVLTLAGHYALEVTPHLSPEDDFEIENFTACPGFRADGTPELRGAVTFARCDGEAMLRETVWLFTRVDFSIGQNDRAIWLAPTRKNPAAFLRLGGRFWLVNLNLRGNALHLDGRSLNAGEAAPLNADQSLRLGGREYAVEIG